MSDWYIFYNKARRKKNVTHQFFLMYLILAINQVDWMGEKGVKGKGGRG